MNMLLASPPRAAYGASRRLVLLGTDPGVQHATEADQGRGPRPEYREIARRLQAPTLAYAPDGHGASLLGRLDPLLESCLQAFRHRGEFDTIYLTGEDLGLRLAPLLRISGWSGRLVMVVHACATERRKRIFRALGHRPFSHIICVCKTQRDILVNKVGFPPEKVSFLNCWVDTKFFAPPRDRPPAAERDYVFACGLENRDYAALRAAAGKLPHRFEVAAAGFRGDPGPAAAATPDNVTVYDRRLAYGELKPRYANARFVVVPLNPVVYAAGVTGLLEAMAMGQAVVVSDSPGIRDYVQHGVSGLVVPPHDPEALARAVAELWSQPERCDEMGRRNRAWVEANASLERYVEAVTAMMGGAPPPLA